MLQAGRVIGAKKVPEVTEAFYVFMGTRWRDFYILSLSLSLLSVNWALAILFGQTVSSSIPEIYHPEETCVEYSTGKTFCSTRYLINILILAAFTTPLAITNVEEQWWIQNTLAVIRVARMLLMCITPMLALTQESLEFSFPGTFNAHQGESIEDPPIFFGSWLGVCFVISASIFGMFLNGNIPIIIDSLEDRGQFATVLSSSFAICLLLYMWLSMTVSAQFGSLTMTPCNLNWVGYRLPFWDTCNKGSICYMISRCFEFIIAFCPAIDVASAYPYISIVLGNSVTEILFGMQEDCIRRAGTSENSPLTAKPHTSRGADVTDRPPPFHVSPENYILLNRLLRLSMNTLPLILGACIVNFSIVVQISGAVSVLVCLFFPAMLSMACTEDISTHGMELRITADNFVKWVDNKLGSCYWVTGASKPLDAKLPMPKTAVFEYLKFALLFDYSAEGVNPEDDIIEVSLTKKVIVGLSFVFMGVILFFTSG